MHGHASMDKLDFLVEGHLLDDEVGATIGGKKRIHPWRICKCGVGCLHRGSGERQDKQYERDLQKVSMERGTTCIDCDFEQISFDSSFITGG